MKFVLESHHRNVPDDELLTDLKSVASELDKPKVTIDEYNERGKFHATTLTRRFGSWFVALEKAGLQRTRNLNISIVREGIRFIATRAYISLLASLVPSTGMLRRMEAGQ